MNAGPLLLVVEDEALVRMVLEEELMDAGYQSVVVTNGHEALRELDGNVGRFGAVITNVRLGAGPDGWEVARHAHDLRPDLPVLFVSGDSAHEWQAKGVPNSVMIPKPYVADQITTALASMLDAADGQRRSG